MDHSNTSHQESVNEHAASSITPPSRKRSEVWEEFILLEPDEQRRYQQHRGDSKARYKCIHCEKVLIGETHSGTSALKRHLNLCAKRIARECEVGVGASTKIESDVYREMIAECVIEHGYPFEWVEHRKTRALCCYLNKDFKSISRNTCKADCLKLHKKMKEKLKSSLEKVSSRISLTSDMWTSCTSDGYLCLTAHYIDADWKLLTKILNFCHVAPPHSANILYNIIYDLLKDWGIERKSFSITLDNASNMNNMQHMLCSQLEQQDVLVCHGQFFHIRCCAHILNLIVQYGLEVIREGLVKVRNCVKYVEGSEARKIKFRECVVQARLNYSKGLWLDVPTRWNSTYLMLERFFHYLAAFKNLARADQTFNSCFPEDDEISWIEKIFAFLKPFYDIIILFSGTEYPTSNLYFESVCHIQKNIDKELVSEDPVIKQMAVNMKSKFTKYWEEHTLVLSFAAILDPRFKLQLLQFVFRQLGPEYENKWVGILEQMKKLFEEYRGQFGEQQFTSTSDIERSSQRDIDQDMRAFCTFDSRSNSNRSELDIYLDEVREDYYKDLDILDYWKKNQFRYPILAQVAKDVLSIPVTTVASESAFSMGGRVINKWRSCLLSENAEMLITTRNWLYGYDDEEKNAITFGREIVHL